ncbi:hypothetical protein D1B33_08120 [Lysinibacillus yapensis]|uniref:Aerobactin siderophore biosynthesis IucA/IucC-like C-terminal domain-containing protein n=1 Tax=Ureibacillus yapensis TaxID=2304605 RepID=A0A396S9A2_9BACL|nr:IucA/IucC family C-terminal-domain containing protein [Lysinibacillus yapensis]RHW37685.1 hypothetical protein D1B33_08120 [Lysinibacillus yapensis]
MHKTLDKSEIEQLRQFRFATEVEPSELSIDLNRLIDETVLFGYLENLGPHIGSPCLKVTASIFVKRYAFLAVIYLYAITAWNKKSDISFENIILQTEKEADVWLPTFYFRSRKVEEVKGSRSEWREEALEELFSKNIHLLIEQLFKVTKQSKLILWENIAIYIFWLYETVLAKSEDKTIRDQAKQDFDFLLYEAPGSLFGNHPTNPIKRFYVNKRYVDHLQEEVRVRTTCCFSNLLKGETKQCKTCPQICNIKKKLF